MVIVSQYTGLSNNYIAHFKLTKCYVNCISIKPEKIFQDGDSRA